MDEPVPVPRPLERFAVLILKSSAGRQNFDERSVAADFLRKPVVEVAKWIGSRGERLASARNRIPCSIVFPRTANSFGRPMDQYRILQNTKEWLFVIV